MPTLSTHIYIYIHTIYYICMYVGMSVYVCVCMYVRVYACMHAKMYGYISEIQIQTYVRYTATA